MNLETLKDEIWRKLESFKKTKKEEDGVTALENEWMVHVGKIVCGGWLILYYAYCML